MIFDTVKLLLEHRANVYVNNNEGRNFFSFMNPNKEKGRKYLKIIKTMEYSEMCMAKILQIIKIYSCKFLLKIGCLRETLVNIKLSMTRESYESLAKIHKNTFEYFGIYDQDSMELKITENERLMHSS